MQNHCACDLLLLIKAIEISFNPAITILTAVVNASIHLAKKTMATVTTNPISGHLRGTLGGIVFRQLRGKTVVSNTPRQTKKESAVQKQNRRKFRDASRWAKAQMHDPQKKSFYTAKAKKLKLPNAYTAAISDYMRKSVVSDVNVSRYNGKTGDVISMKISKRDFDVRHAEIILYDKEGIQFESGVAVRKDRSRFFYRIMETIYEKKPVRICIVAGAPGMIRTMKEVTLDA